jgi:hypothetical protein
LLTDRRKLNSSGFVRIFGATGREQWCSLRPNFDWR